MSNILGFIQTEYLELLQKYQQSMNNNFNIDLIFIIIDDINKFWLKRVSLIEKEIDLITHDNYCMLLSGAIYLDYKDNDHYVYKSLGNYHFLHDSIIRLEGMIRKPRDFKRIGSLFKKAYNDELLVLKNTRNYFYYVPFMIMPNKLFDNPEELIHKAFINFISSMFKMKFNSNDDFINYFNSYEEIERALDSKKLKHIITLSENDVNLPLRKRIENYRNAMPGWYNLSENNSESSDFLFTMFSLTNQVFDILLTCTYYNLTPFIRYNITFHYFILMMHNFISDDTIKKKIEGAIISYIFYHHFDKTKISKMNFDKYCLILKEYNLFDNIRNAQDIAKINIFTGELKKLIRIIDSKIEDFYTLVDEANNI